MPDVIRWENPPTANGVRRGNSAEAGRSQYVTIAEQLRARPGEWAVVEEKTLPTNSNSGLATRIGMGHIRCFAPAGDFQAVTRRINGKAIVYARYLGDGEVSDG